MDAVSVRSAVGQVASALVAVPATFVAYFAYRSSKSASDAAPKLTAIERHRLRAEMRPEFEISATEALTSKHTKAPLLSVSVTLAGPLSVVRDRVGLEDREFGRWARAVDRGPHGEDQAAYLQSRG